MPELDDDDLEAELDALGDEIGLDEDTSYLDDAVSTPSVPTSEPGGESVRVSYCQGERENLGAENPNPVAFRTAKTP